MSSSKLGSRGLLRNIWNYFTKVRNIEKNLKVDCVGKDNFGNAYFIRHADKVNGVKESRWIEPTDAIIEEYGDNLGMELPKEWDAWLRKRRDDPPTLEEMERNEIKRLQMQERIKEIERKERLEKGEEVDANPLTKTISGDTTKTPFPTYDDLETRAGQFSTRPNRKS